MNDRQNDLISLARELTKAGNIGEDERFFKEMIANPHNAMAWHYLGFVLHHRGKLQDAERAYRKAVEINPTQKTSWSGLHKVLIEIGGRVDDAQYAYVKSVEVTIADQKTGEKKPFEIPEDLASSLTGHLTTMAQSLDKGFALVSQRRYDEAEQVFRHVIRNYPDNPRSKLLLADLLVERGKCEESLLMIEEAIKADPHSGFPWTVRGRALGKLGRKKEAVESMKRALEIEPHNRLLKVECDNWFRKQRM
ncbi:MAG: tetratricopeptide repeat protein [Candidatus Thorarchaeota archaeon]|nr:tetratricopeptide repeat protein [Candidatus Thorarchaeota archaeon]